MTIDIGEDAEREVGDLSAAIKLAESYLALIAEIEADEERLEEKKAIIHRMESQDIPEAMAACRAKQLPLLQGGHIEIKEITKCSLPSQSAIASQKDSIKQAEMKKRLNDGLTFLRKHGGEPLIKNFMTLEFDKGKDNVVSRFSALAEEAGVPYCRETTVHNGSLEKFIKELLANGNAVPKDTFGIYAGQKAVVVKPRKKKSEG